MACNPATLLAAASCFQCLSAGEVQLIRLALYCRIANGITMACDIATLLNEASCFQCLPTGERQVAELALLCTIMTNGGGGGGGGTTQVYQDHTGSPPDDPTKAALSFPTGGGPLSQWDVGSQTWV
jgi:hypothetical protein